MGFGFHIQLSHRNANKATDMTKPTTIDKYAAASNMAVFLLEKTGSVCGQWQGTMPAAQQRSLFGRFLGKGKLTIDGASEVLRHTVKVCFGLDYEHTFDKNWSQL